MSVPFSRLILNTAYLCPILSPFNTRLSKPNVLKSEWRSNRTWFWVRRLSCKLVPDIPIEASRRVTSDAKRRVVVWRRCICESSPPPSVEIRQPWNVISKSSRTSEFVTFQSHNKYPIYLIKTLKLFFWSSNFSSVQ